MHIHPHFELPQQLHSNKQKHHQWFIAALCCFCSIHAQAQTSSSGCKERIVAILAGMDSIPAHEEVRDTVIEKRRTGSSQYQIEATKRMVTYRVPPDRFSATLWRGDQIRIETISIGAHTWDRWPGQDWKLQPEPKPGSPNAFVEDVTTRIVAASQALFPVIAEPECLGPALHEGRKAEAFRYDLLISKGELWTEIGTDRPIFERLVTSSDDLRTRVSVTRRFRYDDTIVIKAPQASRP